MGSVARLQFFVITVEDNNFLRIVLTCGFILFGLSEAQEAAILRDLRDPSGARKVTLVCLPRPIRFALRINTQEEPRDLLPLGFLTFRLQKTHVRYDMPFVVCCYQCLRRRATSATSGERGQLLIDFQAGFESPRFLL
jgi:hypothetical protein